MLGTRAPDPKYFSSFFAIATCSTAAQWAKMGVNPAKIETLIFMFSSLF